MNIDTRTKNALAKKKIFNQYQLVRFSPRKYVDNTQETGVSPELNGKQAVVIGTLTGVEMKDMSSRPTKYIVLTMTDRKSNSTVKGCIFGASFFLQKKYNDMKGKTIILCGVLKYEPLYQKSPYSIANPHTVSVSIESNLRIVPFFKKIKGVSEERFLELVKHYLYNDPEEDTIPEEYVEAFKLPPIDVALKSVMFPKTQDDVNQGLKRQIFDDLVYLETELLLQKKSTETHIEIKTTVETEKMMSSLPYNLTKDQINCIFSVSEHMKSGKLINALIQGDVGCGKSIIAFSLMSAVVENGYQAVLMAPTQILASQHYTKLCDLFGKETVCLFDNAMKGKTRKEALRDIKGGKFKYIVGTHALLSPEIEYQSLALGIIDEEHRFGVEQRSKLLDKGIHTITMSATPIPRTLAGVIYGDGTEIYQIITKPEGRKDIITRRMNKKSTYHNMERYLDIGGQIYVVCPLIEEAEEGSRMEGIASVDEVFAECKKQFGSKYPIGLVTGVTKKEDRDRIIEDFRSGKTKVLIATTVIEVGVDVPTANMIVIENAERFGLASLHQLRGRVGRGSEQAYCILVSDNDNERLNAMCETNDGFKIAEADLALRKPGDIIGTKQSGFNKLVEEMINYPKLSQTAKKLAQKLIEEGRYLEHIEKYRLIFDNSHN